MVLRYGHIRYLPPDTGAERYIAIVKSPASPANVQHCELEEQLGTAPQAPDDHGLTVYLTVEARMATHDGTRYSKLRVLFDYPADRRLRRRANNGKMRNDRLNVVVRLHTHGNHSHADPANVLAPSRDIDRSKR
jgi:hypothetical protein